MFPKWPLDDVTNCPWEKDPSKVQDGPMDSIPAGRQPSLECLQIPHCSQPLWNHHLLSFGVVSKKDILNFLRRSIPSPIVSHLLLDSLCWVNTPGASWWLVSSHGISQGKAWSLWPGWMQCQINLQGCSPWAPAFASWPAFSVERLYFLQLTVFWCDFDLHVWLLMKLSNFAFIEATPVSSLVRKLLFIFLLGCLSLLYIGLWKFCQ